MEICNVILNRGKQTKDTHTMEKTGWQRNVGEQVTAQYCGQIVTGTITDKRVAYGNYVKLYLEVPAGFDIYGATRFECIVTEKEIF